MTEECKRWVERQAATQEFEAWTEMASPVSRRAAEFWVRAFCEEVEQRARDRENQEEKDEPYGEGIHHSNDCLVDAFYELKQELLGG